MFIIAIVESRSHQRNVRCTSSERWINSLGWVGEVTAVMVVIFLFVGVIVTTSPSGSQKLKVEWILAGRTTDEGGERERGREGKRNKLIVSSLLLPSHLNS